MGVAGVILAPLEPRSGPWVDGAKDGDEEGEASASDAKVVGVGVPRNKSNVLDYASKLFTN